jgi:hypothetical protein
MAHVEVTFEASPYEWTPKAVGNLGLGENCLKYRALYLIY